MAISRRLPPALLALMFIAGCASGGGAGPAPGGSLEGGPWLVESVDGVAVPAGVRADLTFDPGDHGTGMVAGTGGCNRLRGGWRQAGTTIGLGPLAGTMMMCEPAKMAVEQKLVRALEAATTLGFTADGAALLTAPGGGVVTLRRARP